AEYLLDHGMVDMVVPRGELNETIGRLIDMIRRTKPGAAIVPIKDAKKKPAKKAETEGDNAKK
ncbi:acetyl-CoA carboxylase carboxyl transferase subunit beta, partial [Pseudidiomarina aestuarii]